MYSAAADVTAEMTAPTVAATYRYLRLVGAFSPREQHVVRGKPVVGSIVRNVTIPLRLPARLTTTRMTGQA
jgi:hypothetical protein